MKAVRHIKARTEIEVDPGNAFVVREPLDDVLEAIERLTEDGVEIVDLDPLSPEGAVWIAEAVNAAAKFISPQYYGLKAGAFAFAASRAGVTSAWCDDGTFGVWHKKAGAVHAHDPFGEIWYLGAEETGLPWEWSGVGRQDLALDALGDPELRREIALLTRPDVVGQIYRRMRWSGTAGPKGKLP